MSKKVLFIDRDGTLVLEPPIDYQLDSLSKLEFYPKVFQYMAKIATELDYELVMVTNQDGLGTNSFPEDTFWPAQNKIITAFEKEGVVFSEVLIDNSFPHENAITRKPRTGLLTKYFSEDYDLEVSIDTDLNLAVLGDYTVTYSVTYEGVTYSGTRTVRVVAPSSTVDFEWELNTLFSTTDTISIFVSFIDTDGLLVDGKGSLYQEDTLVLSYDLIRILSTGRRISAQRLRKQSNDRSLL